MSDASSFTELVRGSLAAVDAETVRGWERDGHLPAEALHRLAADDVFRQRWTVGAAEGADRVVAMAEATAEICSGLALAAMGHCEVFCGALHWLAETPAQRGLLDRALSASVIGCLASTEPTGGSDLAAVRTRASRDGDGWRLRGHKRYISNLGGATHALVLAGLDERAHERDLCLFVVPLDAAGVRVPGYFPTLGLAACDVGELAFDVRLPADALLGSSGMGLAYLSRLLQFERLSICAQLLTGGRTALGLAAAFARHRALGTGRLLDKQAVRHRLAHCRSSLWLLEAALRDLVVDTRDGVAVGHRTAALKLEASRIVEQVTDECLQVFGARGYTRHYPLERIWRDTRLARIGGGSEEVLAELVAARVDRPDPAYDAWLDELARRDVAVADPRP